MDLCKAKWNILRASYRRILRNRESGFSKRGTKWRFEDALSFLKKSVLERRRFLLERYKNELGNSAASDDEQLTVKEEPTEIVFEEMSTDDVEEWASSCGSQHVQEQEAKVDPIEDKAEKQNEAGDGDNVRQFFLSLADTVKTLPPLAQARVKAEVFQAVSRAEIKFLEEKANTKQKEDLV